MVQKGSVCRICGGVNDEGYIVMPNGEHVCSNCAEAIRQIKSKISEYEKNITESNIQTDRMSNNANGMLKPIEIKALLDQYIIGQDYSKKILSVACYNHYKKSIMDDKGIRKSNVLLVGPTGSGKTYLVETLAKILNVPVVMAAATTLTEAGYIGDDVETIIGKLLDVAGGDVRKAEGGIVFIDEIDKLSGKSSETEKKVGGKGVQQALLALLEGTIVSVDKSGPRGTGFKVNVNTSGILFICGGAFPEAEEIIYRRISKKTSMGFNSPVDNEAIDKENMLLKITTDDLREFGLIPEFLGRLPVIAPLENLSIAMLKKILSEPKDSILSQFRKLIGFDGIELIFDDTALDLIAEKAYKKGTGARSLRGILEELLLEVMFQTPSSVNIVKVRITKGFVEGNENLILQEKYSTVSTVYA